MSGFDASTLTSVLVVSAGGGLGAALFGDAGMVVDVLAGGGLGAIAGQLVVVARAHLGVGGRSAEIVAAWTAFGAGIALVVHLAATVL